MFKAVLANLDPVAKVKRKLSRLLPSLSEALGSIFSMVGETFVSDELGWD